MVQEWQQNEFVISTDINRLDLDTVHQFLANSYWAEGLPFEVLERAIQHSLVFGLYKQHQQVGFARVVTDYATFAYLSDVFVLETWRGQGLGKWLIETIVAHPELQGLRRWLLATKDAHEFYQPFGFQALKNPDRFMEQWESDIYKR
ncbi:GNAT family N-acetyltransferase [Phormidium tenue FACHB-886]|nr:GNAT family N-acetyltransferase [Phormidium tenue FACHB-886]